MVRKKVRTRFLLFKKIPRVRKKVRTRLLLFKNPNKQNTKTNIQKQTNTNKLTNIVRKKERTQFLHLKKKLHGKEKSKNSILTFQKKNLRVRKKVRT